MTPANISNLNNYVAAALRQTHEWLASIVLSVPILFYPGPVMELLYTHPKLIPIPTWRFVKSSVAGDTTMIQVISKYEMLDARTQALVQTIRNTSPGNGMTTLVDGVLR